MCSPDLTKGICCICFGTLTPDNTLYDDLHEGRGGVHKGVCAILAGIYPDHAAEVTCDALIKRMHAFPQGSLGRLDAYRVYHRYVMSIADEDHYDMSGPE